ncbi:four helix bundle protein [Flavobacterium sp. CLA17]|uniref:four helix bundle protein n=1 Tax=Flavobacterium sp. CLA17 TaxID=2724135 RepID=UPI001F080BE1|nr:four helix bundle protein [Flavobacterium sp. CLA17]
MNVVLAYKPKLSNINKQLIKMEYSKLGVWLEARKLVNLLYDSSKLFPKEELFALTNQMRRAAISIPSNIAEGCGRQTSKETIHFLHISRGSLYELETQYYLALDQRYIDESNFKIALEQIQTCKKLLNGFINYYKKLI